MAPITIPIFLYGGIYKNYEWRKITESANSPFLTVPGCGSLQVEYRRAWWPSIFRLFVTGLPLFLLGTIWLIDTVINTQWNQVAWSSTIFYLFPILLLGYMVWLGISEITHIFLGWPTQTPRSVAVLSKGIAWMEDDSIKYLVWNQIKNLQVRNVFLLVTTTDCRIIKFHHTLSLTNFALKARVAIGEISDPSDLMVCPNCGKEIAKNSSRCLFCMNPINETLHSLGSAAPSDICPECGTAPASSTDQFCRSCGAALEGSNHSDPI